MRGDLGQTGALRRWVRNQNIALFSAKLAGDLSPSQRVVIEALLTHELAGAGDEQLCGRAGEVAPMDLATSEIERRHQGE